jgi:cytochrome o ubiquinol oxidase subunit III
MTSIALNPGPAWQPSSAIEAHDTDGPPKHYGDGDSGPASRAVIVGYGFWIFILSDIIMFAALFATFTVLAGNVDGGPGARQLLDLNNAKIETALLLTSSLTTGLAAVAFGAGSLRRMQMWLAITWILGAGFLALELREFSGLIAQGAGPDRSAFLSSFFGLVGCHGLHVAFGLIWLAMLMAHLAVKGPRPELIRRMTCFGIFWHALDIIWIAILTNVYLIGTLP